MTSGKERIGIDEDLRTPKWAERPIGVFLFLMVFTALAVLGRGYAFGKEDQNLYLPFVLHWNNPALFPHDLLLQQGFARESLAWGLIAAAARVVPLPAVLAVLWTMAGFLMLLLMYKTAMALWGRKDAAWVAVFLWMSAYDIPGVANTTFDDYFTTRILGFLLGLLGLHYFLESKHRLSSAAIFAGGLLHLISVAPIAAGIGLAHALRRRWGPLGLTIGGISLSALAISIYAASFGYSHDWAGIYRGTWLAVVQTANPELFPQLWPWGAWLGLGLYVLAFGLMYFLSGARGEASLAALETLIVCAGIVVCSAIGLFGAFLKVKILIELCFFRGYFYVIFLVALMMAGPISKMLMEGRPWTVFAACWSGFAWISGDRSLQVSSILVLSLVLGRPHGLQIWHRLVDNRRRLLAGVLLVLSLTVVWQSFWYWRGWSPFTWRPATDPLRACLVLSGLGAVFALMQPRVWKRWGAALLPLSMLLWFALVPPTPLLGCLQRHRALRHLYGFSVNRRVMDDSAREREQAAWSPVAALVREKVPTDSSVIIPPDWMDFRLQTFRSPFVTFKDGAPSEFDRTYARLWLARILEVHGLAGKEPHWRKDPSAPDLSAEQAITLARRYGSAGPRYLISRAALDLPNVGHAGAWILYKIDQRSVTPQPGERTNGLGR